MASWRMLAVASLSGLSSAPVIACTCAKGLAVGVVQGVAGLEALWRVMMAPQQHVEQSSKDEAACETVAAAMKAPDLRQLSPRSPPVLDDPDCSGGIASARHALHMRSMLLISEEAAGRDAAS
jgi:hypothetical protein